MEAQQHARIVVEATTRAEAREIGAERLRLQAGDRCHQVLRMRTDVAHRTRDAGLGRIDAPTRLLVAASLRRQRDPALRVLDRDNPHKSGSSSLAQELGGQYTDGAIIPQLEDEWLLPLGYVSVQQAQRDVAHYLLHWYNWQRPYQFNNGLAPAVAEEKLKTVSGMS